MGVEWAWPVWAWPLLLIAAGAAVVFTIRMYRTTAPPVTAGLRRLLTTLRAVALVLLLLAIAGPVLSRLGREVLPATVALVVEDSASMDIADARPSAAVGAAGSAAADTTAGSRALAAGAAATITRWRAAMDLTAELRTRLTAHESRVDVVLLRGNGLEPLDRFGDTDAAAAPRAVGTDLAGLLEQTFQRFAGQPLRAVVLLSDGNETTSRERVGTRSAATAGVNLQLVGLGDPLGPPDRSLRDLRYPDVAFEGDEVVVEATVAQRFAAAVDSLPLTVTLRDDDRVVAQRRVVSSGEIVNLELSFRPEEPGLHLLRLEVTPLDNERYLTNNATTLAVNVRKERARVLLLAVDPGWDVRFVAQAAALERRLQLEVVYPTASGLVLADSLATWASPRTAAAWQVWDGVVLAGWGGWSSVIDWESLATAVTAGMGLWVLPGPGSAATSRDEPPPLPRPLADLLPVPQARLVWRSGEWFAAVTAGAAGHPVLEGIGGEDVTDAEAGFGGLPPLERLLPSEPRPDDRTLLWARTTRRGSAPDEPLLVLGARGEGRVVWFGARRLWELAFWEAPALRRADHEQPARRLLRNLLIWTASGREEAGLALVGRRSVFSEGERIRLEAQFRDLRGEPVVGRQLAVEVRADPSAPDTTARRFSLAAVPGRPGSSEAILPPLPPGRYRVRPVALEDEAVGPWRPLVVTENALERTQVTQDRRRLRQLAAALGGTYHDGSRIEGLAPLLDDIANLDLVGEERRLRQRWDLWSGWPFLIVAASLLGLEWFLRRRNGLL